TNGYVSPVFAVKAEQKMRLMLYKKACSIDLACYDNPEYYNEFILSVTESKTAIDRTTSIISNTVQGIVIVLAYGTFFLVLDPISVLFVFISFIARLLIGKALNKIQFKVKLAEMPFIRKRAYIHRVFYLNDYAKELRLNKESSRGLYEDFNATNNEIYDVRKKVAKKRWGLDYLMRCVFNELIFDGAYLSYLVYMTAVRKAMAFSTMFTLFNAAYSLRQGMVVLSELLPQAMENALYIGKIRSFLEYENKVTNIGSSAVPNKIKTIKFENVSFRYNEKQDFILQNINLVINPMDKIALVGYNGAGKTTLIKLLMRLYDPSEGRITLDGIDIRNFNLNEYRALIGAIFQDYRIYAASVTENVTMDLGQAEEGIFNGAVKLSGFEPRMNEMVAGASTQLTREFDDEGTALSGGESQKLATARVFYKPSGLIILDEPSSALDPIAEYEMNHSMKKAAREKSVVFISHRLSTTKHADRIFMLDRGMIIEEGTHEELLKINGKYMEMWSAQASKYV
ncbi:MAG: ABC transporter ATP-binding protein/permease, partial [Clostridiales bacterium]|nr:ABC transporter ATP-binding protein/permease [Clostridiales bacterium]